MSTRRSAWLTLFDPGGALFERVGGGYLSALVVSFVSVLLASVVGAGLGFAALKLNELALLPEYTVATLAYLAVLGGFVGLLSGLQFWVVMQVVLVVESLAVASVSTRGFEFTFGRLCYSLVVLPVAAGLVVVSLLGMYTSRTLGWTVVGFTTCYLVASHSLAVVRLVFDEGGLSP